LPTSPWTGATGTTVDTPAAPAWTDRGRPVYLLKSVTVANKYVPKVGHDGRCGGGETMESNRACGRIYEGAGGH
jgi:hypothetical protein